MCGRCSGIVSGRICTGVVLGTSARKKHEESPDGSQAHREEQEEIGCGKEQPARRPGYDGEEQRQNGEADGYGTEKA